MTKVKIGKNYSKKIGISLLFAPVLLLAILAILRTILDFIFLLQFDMVSIFPYSLFCSITNNVFILWFIEFIGFLCLIYDLRKQKKSKNPQDIIIGYFFLAVLLLVDCFFTFFALFAACWVF
jgi:hypothetical protein